VSAFHQSHLLDEREHGFRMPFGSGVVDKRERRLSKRSGGTRGKVRTVHCQCLWDCANQLRFPWPYNCLQCVSKKVSTFWLSV